MWPGGMVMGDNYCFGCSPNNPAGLHLHFWREGECEVTEFTPLKEHQSYDGVCHGGLVSTVMDELFGNHLKSLGVFPAVTGRLSIRFRGSVPIGQKIRFVSRILKSKGRLYEMEGWAELPGGQKLVECTAQMMKGA